MSKLDQFASAFKSASKMVYQHSDIVIGDVLVITDLSEDATRRFAGDVKQFLAVVSDRGEVSWSQHRVERDTDVSTLLDAVEEQRPDLICCYRNLHSRARRYPFSLGASVDVLTQATTTPVLLLPAPNEDDRLSPNCVSTKHVMVLTDHLTGCDSLIDHGLRFTSEGGTLVLAHLEDDAVFERYIEIVGKIPAIDTDVARERIRERLLREPADYIGSVRSVLEKRTDDVHIGEAVRMGHRVSDCKELVEENSIDLVVMNTKDDEQLAMHGLAYPLAIELRDVPLLML